MNTAPAPVLSGRELVKHFAVRQRTLLRRHAGEIHAVCNVSLDLAPGETLGLVGESGCGKSTTARLLLNLLSPTSGTVTYGDEVLTGRSRREMRPVRRALQMVFQDPYASLDPRMTVFELVAEPLRIQGGLDQAGRGRVRDLLDMVGLEPAHANRYPHEFSGGQRQRIGIARALATDPGVLVLDEPVSALDVSVRAGILNLLEDLQADLGPAYLFVSHDLAVVGHIADRVAVMYLGRIVESGPTVEVYTRPAHPYTQALISMIPLPDPARERRRERIRLSGELPAPTDPPSGCRFRTRCPLYAGELDAHERARCRDETPELGDPGRQHAVACHFPHPRAVL